MRVYIGIVAYNSAADLTVCLPALRRQTYPDIHLTVFDNASADHSLEVVQRLYPAANLIQSADNLGFGRAHNRIIDHLSMQADDFYMPLNPDVRLAPDYLATVISGLRQHGADWGIGKLLLLNADGEPSGQLYSAGHGILRSGFTFNIGYGMAEDAGFDVPQKIMGASAAACCYSAPLIQRLTRHQAFFDEQMFMYSEDTDVDWRAIRAGLTCWYIPESIAYHHDSHPNAFLRAHQLANRYLSVVKNAFILDLLFINLPIILVHMLIRLVMTPRYGWLMMRLFLQNVPDMWRKREKPALAYAQMQDWFRWSAAQPAGMERSIRARLVSLWRRMRAIHD